jgi:hypothetical protein
MKSVLKAPGTTRLKLQCGEVLSRFAFKFNLRRYTMEAIPMMGQLGIRQGFRV